MANLATSNAHARVTYWIVFAMILLVAVMAGMWKRMMGVDRRKLFGFG